MTREELKRAGELAAAHKRLESFRGEVEKASMGTDGDLEECAIDHFPITPNVKRAMLQMLDEDLTAQARVVSAALVALGVEA